MALWVADVLAEISEHVVIEAPPDAGYEVLGLPLIHAAPEHASKGPLAGMAAGLSAVREGAQVLFAPCDMPLIGVDVYRALLRAGRSAYAVSPHGAEPLVAALGREALGPLLDTLALDAVPRAPVALEAAGARAVTFDDAAPFANVNTPDDLSRLAGR
jgi:molybdopterin-guanine dinucleotide biosynthesis protein A